MDKLIRVTQITPRHDQDNEILVITEFYLTENHELMLKGYCSRCHVEATMMIPLAELIKECPQSADFNAKDVAALHTMGISMPESEVI